ncbi:unnamed protein product [Spirodela intermedia]|uniref:HNH nuclease domain-containing protein n=1 Tax=Spirodela intermedia TaxID=51605 RepID=A0A7I8KNK4_SPIIN|nr:unnamed protein product [Spirodela intermedia]
MARFTARVGLRLPFGGEKDCDPREWRPFTFGGAGGGGMALFKNPVEIRRCSDTRKTQLARVSCRVSAMSRKSGSSRGDRVADVAGEDDGDDDDEEFESDELSCFRGLVLDVSYRPVNVVCWRRAICLEFMEKADVLEYYDQTVPSSRGSFYIPAVLRVPHLLQVVKRRRIKHNLSRKSIFYRDSYTCQYCCSRENLTIDHVMPISRGGEWKWENLVTACSRCNSKKGQKTLEQANMKLIKPPKAPKDYDILSIPLTSAALKMLKSRRGVPEEWLQYLSRPSP